MQLSRWIPCVLALGCLLAGAATPSWADAVTYKTDGLFDPHAFFKPDVNSTTVLQFSWKNGLQWETIKITYDKVAEFHVNTPESQADFGTFSIQKFGSDLGNVSPNGTFDLKVTQIAPPATPNNQTFEAILGGHIDYNPNNNNDKATLTFSQTQVTIGGVTYALNLNGGNVLYLDSPAAGTNPAIVKLTATVTAVPEPTTFAGAGLAGILLAGYGWRWRKRTA